MSASSHTSISSSGMTPMPYRHPRMTMFTHASTPLSIAGFDELRVMNLSAALSTSSSSPDPPWVLCTASGGNAKVLCLSRGRGGGVKAGR